MIYTDLTKRAIKLMFKLHKDQLDRAGIPYIFHPWSVANEMEDEYSTIVALLHDTVEDTDITLNDLKSYGFPAEVLEALSLMTHDDDVDYFDYVKTLAPNPIARKVKLADLRHNSDLTRINNVTEKDLARVEKYRKAIEYLESFDGK